MISGAHPLDGAARPQGVVPADRSTIALAGVRAARGELCRAAGLLRRAIALAAMQDVEAEQLARAAGTSLEQVRRMTTDPAGPDGGARADRGARGDRS